MKIRPLLISLITVGLTACGGSNSGDASVDNNKPSDFPSRRALYAAPGEPDAAEQQKIHAGKDYYSRYINFYGTAGSQRFVLDGHNIFTHMHTGDGAIAHVDARSLPQGFADRSVQSDVNGVRTKQKIRSYQGFRSGIMVLNNELDGSRFTAPFGYKTPIAQIPTQGKATYSGTAFDQYERGNVTYHVDFADRSGYGEITGLNRLGTITLHKAGYAAHADDLNRTTKYYNLGEATAANGAALRYNTMFYGDKAEELVGEVIGTTHTSIGFHGTRGEITE